MGRTTIMSFNSMSFYSSLIRDENPPPMAHGPAMMAQWPMA